MENGVLQIDRNGVLEPRARREKILEFEKTISEVPGAKFGDSDLCPLKHSFAEGVYVREIFIPKGTLMTGKIHRHSHPNFLMKGEVLVFTENNGREHLKAPLSMISLPGTKRAIYAIEDTVWITVHVTNETDLEKIEEYVIAPTYGDLLEAPAEPLKIVSELESKNCLILALKERGRDYSSLLDLKAEGTDLPFIRALQLLSANGIKTDDLFAKNVGDYRWHIVPQAEGFPLRDLALTDSDMVGTWAGVAIGTATVGSTVAGSLLNKGQSIEQKPMLTPEQINSQRILYNYGQTGQYGGHTAGEAYGGPLGDFNLTGYENQGLSKLGSILGSGTPDYLSSAQDYVKKLLGGNYYDPNNDGGVYHGLTAGIDQNTQDAQDAARRSASYAGNLYSTDAYRTQGRIASDAANQKSGILANLFQNYTQNQLSGIGQASNLATASQNLDMGKLGAAFQYGSLPRTLNSSQDQAQYQEYIRQLNDSRVPLNALTSVLGTNANFGVQNIPTANPWASTLNLLSQTGANLVGRNYGYGQPGTTSPPELSGYQWGQ